ncbi:hypothetical protein ACQVRV_00120 (plasmid) [Ralstonia pseudosolanacearum]
MDDKTQRIIEKSTAGFFTNLTYGALTLVIGVGLGYLLGLGLSRAVRSKVLGSFFRYLCPFIGLLAAGPLAFKLFSMG